MASYPSYAATSTQKVSTSSYKKSDAVARSKILLLGLRRSGKTSIQQVLFENLPPKQTFYLEPTTRIIKHTYDTVIPLEIWDCPGTITVETLGAPLSQFLTIIFVIDIRVRLHPSSLSRRVEHLTGSLQPTHIETCGIHSCGVPREPKCQY